MNEELNVIVRTETVQMLEDLAHATNQDRLELLSFMIDAIVGDRYFQRFGRRTPKPRG